MKFLILLVVSAGLAKAKQGYFPYSKDAPMAVSKIWNSVFNMMVERDVLRIGSASLIHVSKLESSVDLFFITNFHIIDEVCPEIGVCEGLALTQDVSLEIDPEITYVRSRYGLYFNSVKVVKRSHNPDLAILIVRLSTSDKSTVAKIPRVIPFPGINVEPARLEKLYSVGFPKMQLRHPNEKSITKKWSEGKYLSRYSVNSTDNPMLAQLFYGTTVDLLGGASGSPVVDELGQLVGVMKRSYSTVGNGFRYKGNDETGPLGPQSDVIPGHKVYDFIYK